MSKLLAPFHWKLFLFLDLYNDVPQFFQLLYTDFDNLELRLFLIDAQSLVQQCWYCNVRAKVIVSTT